MIKSLTAEHKVLYDDALEASDGRIYKVVGDLHPSFGLICLLEYVRHPNGRKHGFEKTFDFLIPDFDQRVMPTFHQWNIPLYNRTFEIVPLSEIKREFKPEDAAKIAKEKLSPNIKLADDFLEAFSQASEVDRSKLGLNGSWMLNLAWNTSNINIDVFGAAACLKVMNFMSKLGQYDSYEGFYSPHPKRGRIAALLYGLWQDAFKEQDEAETYKTLSKEGRELFSGFYGNTSFTVQYHAWHRGEDTRQVSQQEWQHIHRTIIEADITDNTGLLQYHSPSTVGLANVRDCILGTSLEISEVSSWSKRFWYTQPGDKVRFLADIIDTPQGLRLAVPGFSRNWIFKFISRNTIN